MGPIATGLGLVSAQFGPDSADIGQRRQMRALLKYPLARTCILPRPETHGREVDVAFCAGHCLERGLHGYDVDRARAVEMYRIAAQAGHTAAAWRLGELLEFGRGVRRDEAEAARWYRQAAEQGCPQAQSGIALLLEDGRGCDQDRYALSTPQCQSGCLCSTDH